METRIAPLQTRFEQIAAAFPLHAQRIAELAHQSDRLEWLREVPSRKEHGAAAALLGAFAWANTSEGFDYWEAIAFQIGYVDGNWS